MDTAEAQKPCHKHKLASGCRAARVMGSTAAPVWHRRAQGDGNRRHRLGHNADPHKRPPLEAHTNGTLPPVHCLVVTHAATLKVVPENEKELKEQQVHLIEPPQKLTMRRLHVRLSKHQEVKWSTRCKLKVSVTCLHALWLAPIELGYNHCNHTFPPPPHHRLLSRP